MRKEISPEMYNYNKFPGPQFITFENHVKSDGIDLLILENEKEAFDVTTFSQRFSEILLKYDYIVGDFGNEQLRLKGFYKDSDGVKRGNRISRLEDYIKEYCNFGCAYFILENPEPKEIKFEPERRQKRRRNTRNCMNQTNFEDSKKRRPNQKEKKNRENQQKGRGQKKQQQEAPPVNQHFVIRKKEK